MQRALSGTQENDFWNVQFENAKKNGRSLTRKISHAFNEAFHTNVAKKNAVLNRVRSENFNTKKARFSDKLKKFSKFFFSNINF